MIARATSQTFIELFTPNSIFVAIVTLQLRAARELLWIDRCVDALDRRKREARAMHKPAVDALGADGIELFSGGATSRGGRGVRLK